MSFFDLPPIIERMLLVSDKISDLNFSVGQVPQVEINGKLPPVQPLGMQKLSPYQTEIIAMTLMHGHPDAAEKDRLFILAECMGVQIVVVRTVVDDLELGSVLGQD